MATINENFVIHDAVHHIYEKKYYHSHRSFFHSFRNSGKNLLLYITIIVISCATGFFAVHLPDMMHSGASLLFPVSPGQIQSILQGTADANTMQKAKTQFNKLNEGQKANLLRQLKGEGR
jgi:hypothetical protein